MLWRKVLDSHARPLGIFMKDEGGEGGGGGGQGDDWRLQLPEELRNNPSISDTPDIATLAKRFIDTKALVGKSLRLPSEEAGDEDWNKFYDDLMGKVPTLMRKPDLTDKVALERIYEQLGKPGEADAYTIPEIDNQGVNVDKGVIEKFKQIAFENGLSQTQFDNVVKSLTGDSIQQALEMQKRIDEDVQSLVKEWGAAYDKNLSIARAVAKKLGTPDFLMQPLLSGTPPSSSAKFFYSLAESIGKEGTEIIDNSGDDDVMTPAEAQMQMSEMRRNRDNPLNIPGDPGHKAALVKYQKLAHLAYPAS